MTDPRRTTSSLPKLTYSLPEAAEVIGISVETLKTWIERGEIRVIENQTRRTLVPVATLPEDLLAMTRKKGEAA